MSKPTPGPWFAACDSEGWHVDTQEWSTDAIPRADAVLIAAAPDLLRELRTAWCPRPCNQAPADLTTEQCMKRGECGCSQGAAIAKATGET